MLLHDCIILYVGCITYSWLASLGVRVPPLSLQPVFSFITRYVCLLVADTSVHLHTTHTLLEYIFVKGV